MTQCEKFRVHSAKNNVIKFYGRYVDYRLLLVKRKDINHILDRLNRFHSYLQFTVDTFGNVPPHFLNSSKQFICFPQRYSNRTVCLCLFVQIVEMERFVD